MQQAQLLAQQQAQLPAQQQAHDLRWSSKKGIPAYVQTDFGRFGHLLPLDGLSSCGATSLCMSVMWLISNGFSQLKPSSGSTSLEDDLVCIFDGLANEASGRQHDTVIDDHWYRRTIKKYLRLKGIDPMHFEVKSTNAPDAGWLDEQNRDPITAEQNLDKITVVNIAIGWYGATQKLGTVTRNGQHWIVLVSADRATQKLEINNPFPGSFCNVPNVRDNVRQQIRIARFSGRIEPPALPRPEQDYFETNVQFAHPAGPQRGILEMGYALLIDREADPKAKNYHKASYPIDKALCIDLERAPLEVLAKLSGTGGIQKWGAGELILTEVNDTKGTSGHNQIHQGLLVSTVVEGTPFGTGPIKLAGSGGLAVRPRDSESENVVLAVAGDPASTLTYAGGNEIDLDRGDHHSMTVTIGGSNDGVTRNFQRGDRGTLRIVPSNGLEYLGEKERLEIEGSFGNLPPISKGGMVHASVVGHDKTGGAFLTYREHGFVRATCVSSLDRLIRDSGRDTLYSVDDEQRITPGETARAFAIRVGRYAVKSTRDACAQQDGPAAGVSLNGGPIETTLQIGDQNPESAAGVILNGGSIETTTLQFGDAEGVVYTTGDGKITSNITGTGGLTCFGPGRLRLTGNNSYSGGTFVNSGELTVANTEGDGLGRGDVRVRTDGTLIVEGRAARIHGTVRLERRAKLILAGGTIGGLRPVHDPVAGVSSDMSLNGFGTIAGHAVVSGTIRAGKTLGKLIFQGPVEFHTTSFYWTLAALDDDAGHEGVSWNSVVFARETSFGDPNDRPFILLDFSKIASRDPNSDDPFWRQPHRWILAQFMHSPVLANAAYVQPSIFLYKHGYFQPALYATPQDSEGRLYLLYFPT